MGSALLVAVVTLALGQGASPPSPPPTIGWAEIERAKALLEAAKGELQPGQYELLESELVQAETAFQRFSALAKASGEAAEVVRAAEALTIARRTSLLTEGLNAVSRVGPSLVALALLWPAETATESQERPPKFVAKIDLEASLKKLAASSQKVAEEMKAAAPQQSAQPAKKPKDSDKCGTCVCYYRGRGKNPLGQKPTRRLCKESCEQTIPPAGGMTCTGDKAVEWWN